MRVVVRGGVWQRVAVVGAVALGCAGPSRHLTTRKVDDPMVLPRGLASFAATSSVARFTTSHRTEWELLTPTVRLGLTDRLELSNLSLRYAFLDDAPAPEGGLLDGRRRGPLSLALQAGVNGIGWSSINGFIVIPEVELSTRKHLGGRTYLWASVAWSGAWVAEPRTFTGRYTASLWPTGRSSRLAIDAGALVQAIDHLAISAGVGAHQLYACFVPSCDWASRGVTGYVGPIVRPWRWMDFSVFGSYGTRERENGLVVPSPDPNTTPMPLTRISWLELTATLTFRW